MGCPGVRCIASALILYDFPTRCVLLRLIFSFLFKGFMRVWINLSETSGIPFSCLVRRRYYGTRSSQLPSNTQDSKPHHTRQHHTTHPIYGIPIIHPFPPTLWFERVSESLITDATNQFPTRLDKSRLPQAFISTPTIKSQQHKISITMQHLKVDVSKYL